MGLGTTPRPHLITWDYGAGYRASSRYVANTMHFLPSVSRQALNRSRIAPSGPHLVSQTLAIPPASTPIDTVCPSCLAPLPARVLARGAVIGPWPGLRPKNSNCALTPATNCHVRRQKLT